jgi:hypothetical protein
MKKITNKIFQFVTLALILFSFKACIEPEDLVTSDAKTGGLVEPQISSLPYKLNATPSIEIPVIIPKGPGVTSVEVHNVFTTVDGEASNDVVITTLNIGGANQSAEMQQTISLTYTDLINNINVGGNPLPANEVDLNIGDSWTLSYTAKMDDGRTVENGSVTIVGVANFFAGNYDAHIVYHHPSYGTYPNDVYVDEINSKSLTALDASTCKTDFGVWGTAGETIYITVNPDYSISITVENWSYDVSLGDPNDPSKVSHYDPATGIIYLYYSYSGAGGFRIFWEEFVPS